MVYLPVGHVWGNVGILMHFLQMCQTGHTGSICDSMFPLFFFLGFPPHQVGFSSFRAPQMGICKSPWGFNTKSWSNTRNDFGILEYMIIILDMIPIYIPWVLDDFGVPLKETTRLGLMTFPLRSWPRSGRNSRIGHSREPGPLLRGWGSNWIGTRSSAI